MIPAVILCGGLGTRLQGVLDDRPKCLAPIRGRTYLDYLTDYLYYQGVRDFVFATGYRHHQVESWVQSKPRTWTWRFSREDLPLGTGGAIRLAAEKLRSHNFLVLNGDTFLQVDCKALLDHHFLSQSQITLAAVQVDDTSAFGRIECDSGKVILFREKGVVGPGLINGGVYLIQHDFAMSWPIGSLSLEKDVLMQPDFRPGALVSPGRFLDIGTPADLSKAGEWIALHYELSQ